MHETFMLNAKKVAKKVRCKFSLSDTLLSCHFRLWSFVRNNILSTQLMHVRQQTFQKVQHIYFLCFEKIFKCHYITKRIATNFVNTTCNKD